MIQQTLNILNFDFSGLQIYLGPAKLYFQLCQIYVLLAK